MTQLTMNTQPPLRRKYEGVFYYPFLVRFTTEDGRRLRARMWSPGLPWVGSEVRRYLDGRGDVDARRPVTIWPMPWRES
jgi:hypothetical protein